MKLSDPAHPLQLRLAEIRAEKLAANKQWVAARFGVYEADVLGYNSGSCYDKAWVTNRQAAEKISAAMLAEKATVNGGCFHGMSLGAISAVEGGFEVTC